jgi:tRNA-2-methylthio-N6-dimethylallyladenosine synthase
MKIAVCGCMMQQKHIIKKIIKKYSFVDIIFGTHNIHEFPILLKQNFDTGKTVYKVLQESKEIVEGMQSDRKYVSKAYVKIMQGCNNFCSYCVVPYTRGREKSRKKEDILNEIVQLSENGTKEVILLGQNVNSYGIADHIGTSFSELLRQINKIEKIQRIRFMTSHPKDLSDELIETMYECDKICNHLHLPLQSGSSRILKLMNRKYDQSKYLSLVEKIKKTIPNISLTTDIIVGYPTESEEDFQETLNVMQIVRYDSAYTFIYSPRKGTKAYEMEYSISQETIKKRFKRLLDMQQTISEENNIKFMNTIVDVLTEGKSKTDINKLSGRTTDNRLVNFQGTSKEGETVKVLVTKTRSFYLEGIQI